MSKKEEIEKLREEVELEELRVKREKQKAAQRLKSVSKYSLIALLVIGSFSIIGLRFGDDETVMGYVLLGMFVFGLVALFGYALSKDNREGRLYIKKAEEAPKSKHWELTKRLREKDKKKP